MFEWQIRILPEVSVKKVVMQCTKMKTHTETCKIIAKSPELTISFFQFSRLNTRNGIFLIIEISMGFPYISDTVFKVFCQSSNKRLHFSRIGVTLENHKGQLICVELDDVTCCV